MTEQTLAIDQIAQVFCQATKKTLDKSTKLDIKYSQTVQRIPRVSLRPELGCFVQFSGDYNGLVVMNYSSEAALKLYKAYMTTMGLPPEELAKDATSNEVVDTMGEMTNQIMGRSTRMVEAKFDLTAKFGQPKALFLNSAITLALESVSVGVTLSQDSMQNENRRIVFKAGSTRFHMELAMEKTDFITIA